MTTKDTKIEGLHKADTFEVKSTGLYSSFCFFKPSGTLFDCGEGAAEYFKNRVFAIKSVFLTHSHWDHIGGLVGLIGARSVAMGTKNPLKIYYPWEAYGFEELIAFLKSRVDTTGCEFLTVSSGFHECIKDNLMVLPFNVQHSKGSLGYVIREKRKRLRREYVGQDIQKLKKEGLRDCDLAETYLKNIFAYTLDSYDFDFSEIEGVDHWVADATFLSSEDRESGTHMTWEEALEVAIGQKVKHVILSHSSSRYRKEDKERKLQEYLESGKYSGVKISYT